MEFAPLRKQSVHLWKGKKAMATGVRGGAGGSYVKSARVMLAWVLFSAVFIGGNAQSSTTLVPAIITFGDSAVDVGNNDYLPTVFKADFPPYGRDFVNHQPTGRFCNGKLATDITADTLGFTKYPAAYLSPEASGSNLLIGANFASAGSGYYDHTAIAYHAIPLSQQLQYYREYQSKLAQVAGSTKATSILSEALYILGAGSSDFVQNYYINPWLNKVYSPDEFSSFLISIFSSFVKDLYGLGGRRLGVTSLPPFGCLPATITLFGGGSNDCIASLNNDAQNFNKKLKAEVSSLSKQLSGLKIVVFDIYTPFLDLVTSPSKNGFFEARKGCCGTGTVETSVLCNPHSPGTCKNATGYVFFDSVHPTAAANQVLADSLIGDGLGPTTPPPTTVLLSPPTLPSGSALCKPRVQLQLQHSKWPRLYLSRGSESSRLGDGGRLWPSSELCFMGFSSRLPWLPLRLLLWWTLLLFCFGARGDGAGGVQVRFLEAPRAFSPSKVAAFEFEVLEEWSGLACSSCSIKCKLDNLASSSCNSRKAYYPDLPDGDHRFEVCANRLQAVGCASYNWTVDTVPPTAYISPPAYFTNATNVSVDISFSEPCTGGGGFRCFVNDCNLLVYGAAQVVPSSLKVLQPDLKYSLLVSISTDSMYGRLLVVMDKSFCTDSSGNRFKRMANSSFLLHFDRRDVYVDMKTLIPKKLLQINNATRTVEATNNDRNLKVYLYFSVPVVNSSSEILSVFHTTAGVLIPTNRRSHGNRRFGFLVKNMSRIDIVSLSIEASSIISRQGTAVSPTAPVTFLYDAERPSVILSTSSRMRTREHIIPVLIKFVKPVFGFNSSAMVIYGGHLLSFHQITRSIYTAKIHADERALSVKVLENTTVDVSGNGNVASNLLQVRHYSIPIISTVISGATTIVFVVTSFAAALVTISTASLLSFGVLSQQSSYFTSEPSRNLMRIAYHIQVFAQCRWLAATMPIEYYEFARGVQWSIPYLSLPWENKDALGYSGSSMGTYSVISRTNEMPTYDLSQQRNGILGMDIPLYGTPLTPIEYRSLFLENQNMKPEAEYIVASQSSNGWKDSQRNMFWLAIIGGGLMLIHAVILFTLKFRRKSSDRQNDYGALVFPRFEIFLILLAMPCVCQASAAIIEGHSTGGIIVAILLLGLLSALLLSLLLFISLGISMGKLLQYKEVHQEGQKFHWYQEIVRVSLGPGKRGQWTWKDQANSIYLTRLGPLFEDLRGPPKYMLSQISARGSAEKHGDRIIASDDETEDAEAPFIQKVFGILRIYYTLLETVKRVSVGLTAGFSASGSSKVPTLVALSITSFQLFFLVLKKPFIKKKVQLVEIISVTSEVGVLAACIVLLEKNFSNAGEQRIGIFMLALFTIGFSSQMVNEWYALYRQVRRLSPNANSFSSGLKTALIGFLLILLPPKLLEDLDGRLSSGKTARETGEGLPPSGQVTGNSDASERPWMRQLRELAKASFSKDDGGAPGDPSTSQSRWSGFWGGKRSGSSSITSSSDSKAKPKALDKDLEAIFSSK